MRLSLSLKNILRGLSLLLLMVMAGCRDPEVPKPGLQQQLLQNWQFREEGKGEWLAAQVPGAVQGDLWQMSMIGDPRLGNWGPEWEEKAWEYRLRFATEKGILDFEQVDLLFEGLDTYAEVWLNDSLILQADNMFREWRLPVRPLLREGENELRLRFLSPVRYHREKGDISRPLLPADNDAGELKVAPYTRKAAFQFGWDWAPRLQSLGIWRPVSLQAWDRGRIADLYIRQLQLGRDTARLQASFGLESDRSQPARVQIWDRDRDSLLLDEVVHLRQGPNELRRNFDIAAPELWWPRGYGEAHLYHLEGRLLIGDDVVDRQSYRLGLRTLELVQEEDEWGKSFAFEVNGQRIFAKGANWVPPDPLLQESDSLLRALVVDAVRSNMNMLRVWAGGVYERDRFYDLCDSAGILVWQDLMLAHLTPMDSSFRINVLQEVRENVKRLRRHPSLALWCGNNELEVAWKNWGWQEKYGYAAADSERIWNEYLEMFHQKIPGEIKSLDKDRPYVPTSPLSNWGDSVDLGFGSNHYWGVWHGEQDFEMLQRRVPRFMGEYGMQSIPEMKTIEKVVGPNPEIEDLALLQKSYKGNSLLLDYVERYYGSPEDAQDFIYRSQLTQALAMEMAIQAHRLRQPRCAGTLYWQLNDCWPGISWSGRDVAGRWKAAQYAIREAYKDQAIFVQETDSSLRVVAVNDGPVPVQKRVRMQLMGFGGQLHWEESKMQSLMPGLSLVAEYALKPMLEGRSRRSLLFRASLASGEMEDLHYFVRPKDLDLPKAAVEMELISSDTRMAVLELHSDQLAKNVWISSPGREIWAENNFFDLLPGEARQIRIEIRDGKGPLALENLVLRHFWPRD